LLLNRSDCSNVTQLWGHVFPPTPSFMASAARHLCQWPGPQRGHTPALRVSTFGPCARLEGRRKVGGRFLGTWLCVRVASEGARKRWGATGGRAYERGPLSYERVPLPYERVPLSYERGPLS
jgi:hypothetical protein